MPRFPRLYAAASLKPHHQRRAPHCDRGFPRLYAAASLKHSNAGLKSEPVSGFPRLYAAASLKRQALAADGRHAACVFRGFMPRPH